MDPEYLSISEGRELRSSSYSYILFYFEDKIMVNLTLPSPINGHVGYFQFITITKSAVGVINVHMLFPFLPFSPSSFAFFLFLFLCSFLPLAILAVFLFKFLYLFYFEREQERAHVHMQAGEDRERRRERIPSRLQAQHRAQHGAPYHEP